MKKRSLLLFAVWTVIFFLFGTGEGQIPLPEIPGNDTTEIPPEVPDETPVPEWIQTQDAIQMQMTDIAETQKVFAVMQTQAVWNITIEAFNAEQTRVAQTQAAFDATQTQTAVPIQKPTATPVPTNADAADELFRKGDAFFEKQDYEEAVKWYRLAAEQGFGDAQTLLGMIYYFGIGVTQDYEEAAKWVQKAADQGILDAQINLGNFYYYGEGVPQDYEEAVKWYRLAADQGNAVGQQKLGNCYLFGEGVPQDYEEAVKWYRLAADQGLAEAQFILGILYEYGEGVTQDYEEAVKWYRLAADQGNEKAAQALEEIMTGTVTPTPTPTKTQNHLAVGDVLTFGRYEQDNDLSSGPEPIEWRVLAVENGQALLISKYGLDTKPYHEKYDRTTWEKCSLRKWLNEDFYNNAFDNPEKSRILQVTIKNPDNPKYGTQGGADTTDRFFLLSIDEANRYFASNNDRICRASDYAKENGAFENNNGSSNWWLRAPGNFSFDAVDVRGSGGVNITGDDVDYVYNVVRPAFWLDL